MEIGDFLNPDDIRKHIRVPFKFNGHTVATNGYSLICLPNDDEYGECSELIKGMLSNVFEPYSDLSFVDMPVVKLPEKEKCSTCEGSGKAISTTCMECDGEGEVDAETDYSVYYGLECKSCEGDGKIKSLDTDDACPDCSGDGKRYAKDEGVQILGLKIGIRPYSLLVSEPDVQISPLPDKSMLYFKSGDKWGVFMSMRND